MSMLTQMLAEGAQLFDSVVLLDTVDILAVGEPVTVGFEVTRPLEPLANGVPAVVQQTNLQNAVESRTESTYSVKVSRSTLIDAGMAVRVVSCVNQPELIGKVLLVDKVSRNGMAMLHKAVASDFETVNQEGKEGLS
jgi:hypothetical protein